jgi:hypothetical protein
LSIKKSDGKIIYFSFIGLIALILTITFCILTIRDTEKFGAAFITIISVVIGYFFKTDNISRETIIDEKK